MACFLVTFRLGLADLFNHRRLVLMMSLSIATAYGMFILVATFKTGLSDEFGQQKQQMLLVHESQNPGEITGSRISSQVGSMLSVRGVSMIIPEIHVVTGSSAESAVLLRGIDLAQYNQLETYSLLTGRALEPGDAPRQAMIGTLLAKRLKVGVGDMVSLRGRNFKVISVFENGTYMDNQAWISLADAQNLLGWGDDVSVYIIPDEGILHDGDNLPDGISVTRKGKSLSFISAQYQPILDLMSIVSITLGVAAALALTNILWRLAWLRRREMAILRSTGFPAFSLAGYLIGQAVSITVLGLSLGGTFALFTNVSMRLVVSSVTLVPRLDSQAVISSLVWSVALILSGSLLPAWWLSNLNLARLLHSE